MTTTEILGISCLIFIEYGPVAYIDMRYPYSILYYMRMLLETSRGLMLCVDGERIKPGSIFRGNQPSDEEGFL